MEYISIVIQVAVLLVCPIWLYFWLNKPIKTRLVPNLSTHYTIPEWYFVLKRWWAIQCLKKKRASEKRQNEGKKKSRPNLWKLPDEPKNCGTLENENSSDSSLFYATDQKGNWLFVKLTLRKHEMAELWLQLTLSDGRIYQLPHHPDTVISSSTSRGWIAGDLKIVLLDSWRRWRITFNGVLRNGVRRNIHHDVGKLEHVRFNFVFIAGSDPILWPNDWSPGLQGDALARELWNDSKWMDMIKLLDSNGFDQWGSMIGQLTFEDSSTSKLYLRGLRQRRWGKHEAMNFHRGVSFFGQTSNGTMYCLGANSLKSGLTHMQFGHIREANNHVHAIDWMDFNLINFAEQRENIPTIHTIHFKAGGKTYKVVMHRVMDTGGTLYGGQPWDWEGRILNLKLKLNDNIGIGVAQLWYTYNGTYPLQPALHVHRLSRPDVTLGSDVYVIPFQDKICQSETIVGGKGSSLALLTTIENKDFTVPQGFCVTTTALHLQIESSEQFLFTIESIEEVSTGKKIGNLKETCEKAVTLIENITVVKPVEDAILRAIEDLKSYELTLSNKPKQTLRYAVRSSAVGEDSEETSSAGQNSTFLGIKDTEVVTTVAKCWASLFSYRSVEYRRYHGLPVKSSMGVCVQIMANAEAAGVMFTRHPSSGDPRNIIIAANYGLGESVVSAMIEPDTIMIQQNWDGTLAIKDSILGKKTKKVSVTDETGTIVKNLSDSETKKICISHEIALRLAKLGLHLETLFGTARDVEWAIIEERIFLLQARPITVLDAWTDFELMHELDSGVPNDTDVLIFSNVGEVLPGAFTPLSLSTIVKILNNSIYADTSNKCPNSYYEACIWVTNMRCTFNYYNTILRNVEKKISLINEITDIAICGHPMTTPEVYKIAQERNGVSSFMYRYFAIFDMIKKVWYNETMGKRASALNESYKFNASCFLRAEDLYNEIDNNLQILYEAVTCHTHTSQVSVFCQILAMSILIEGNEDFTIEHYSDIAILLGSCGDVISAQVPLALYKIARSIKTNRDWKDFATLDPSKTMDWLKLHCPTVVNMIDNFLKEHGHRCFKEFDFATETWDMKPEKFLIVLQTMVVAPDRVLVTKELSPEETVARLKTPTRSGTRWILKKIVPLCRRAVTHRELTKATLISIEHNFRLAYRKLGKLMIEESRLPDEHLLYFLTHQEIGQLLRNRNPALVQKAIRRRRIFPLLEKLKYPEWNIGIPMPIEASSKAVIHKDGNRAQGTSVSTGSVLGRACVVLELSEAAQLQSGDILITHSTDIGWSPYFPLLGGIVTELGGFVSHGAVIAREYGLPCLVGVDGATLIFKTGDIVLLAGNTGVLQVVEKDRE